VSRHAFSASAEAVHLQADTRLSGRVSDINRGECYVDTINPFPVDADVKIWIVKDNLSLYVSTGFGMGAGVHEDRAGQVGDSEWVAGGIEQRVAVGAKCSG
jgi:hypothetical protein